MAAGRPAWVPPEREKVVKLAALGLTQEQIAQALGISYMTLNRKKKQFSDFCEAIKEGQAMGIMKVTSALMKQIENGNTRATIFYLESRAGWAKTIYIDTPPKAPKDMTPDELAQALRQIQQQGAAALLT